MVLGWVMKNLEATRPKLGKKYLFYKIYIYRYMCYLESAILNPHCSLMLPLPHLHC